MSVEWVLAVTLLVIAVAIIVSLFVFAQKHREDRFRVLISRAAQAPDDYLYVIESSREAVGFYNTAADWVNQDERQDLPPNLPLHVSFQITPLTDRLDTLLASYATLDLPDIVTKVVTELAVAETGRPGPALHVSARHLSARSDLLFGETVAPES